MKQWTDEGTCAFDFEASGTLPEYALQPWRLSSGDFWATSLVWVWRDGARVQVDGGLAPDRKMMQRFLEWLILEKRRGVGWNTVYDLSIFLAYGFDDLVHEAMWLDGMLAYRHLEIEPEYDLNRESKRSFGLKPAVEVFLPEYAGYADDIDYHSIDPVELQKLHDYNIRDCVFTLRITRRIWKALAAPQQRAALFEAECLPMVAGANLRGMQIDILGAKALKAQLDAEADDALSRLAWHGVTEEIIRSPTKLAALIFDQWRLPLQKMNVGAKTNKVSRSTDKEVLHELSFLDPRVKVLRTYREALNNRKKFAETPLEACAYNGDNKAHPLARVFGTYSGRMTYASKQGKNKDARQIGWAIHQEKRDANFREIMIPPAGYALMEFDASGQEYRWMAVASGDPTMMQLCQPGEDPHSFMGARVTNYDYRTLIADIKNKVPGAKPRRQLGKVDNLSLQYKTSANRLRIIARVDYDIPMEMPEANHHHAMYRRTYVRVPIYWENQIKRTKTIGYVETFAGRRVKLQGDWNGPMGWKMGMTSINDRIQGTGADQKYLALAVIKNYLHEIGAHFAFDMHDGIYLYVPLDRVDQTAIVIKPLLDHLPYKQAWGFTPPVPLPWDCKVGPSWGALEEYKFQ